VFLAAEEGAGARALQATTAAGHEVVGVLTAARGAPLGGTAAAAERAGVAVVSPESVDDGALAELLRCERVDVLLNVHSLRVLGEEVLAAPSIGCFNLHPGPLPRFAGLNVPSWAIYEGVSEYGCTLHWMTAEIDAGPVAYAARFEVDPDETGLSLSLKCIRYGLPLIERLLAETSNRVAIPAQEQRREERRYLPPGPPRHGYVEWAEPAARVDALVRACTFDPFPSPWGRAKGRVGGTEVALKRVTRTGEAADAPAGTVGEARLDAVMVAAADEWVAIREVEVDGEPAEPTAVLTPGATFESAAGSAGRDC
jgi:methionyl-tRNA formyltransferase